MAEHLVSPWENEPDFKVFEEYGFPCVIIRNPEFLYLCGYVGVPKSHPLYGLHYDDTSPYLTEILKMKMGDFQPELESPFTILDMMFKGGAMPTPAHAFTVHRGITFSGIIEDKRLEKRFHSHWFFGFDCAHHGDYIPAIPDIEKVIHGMLPNLDVSWLSELNARVYRDMPYVESQLRMLAMQLYLVLSVGESNENDQKKSLEIKEDNPSNGPID